jgi:hypothetical protein
MMTPDERNAIQECLRSLERARLEQPGFNHPLLQPIERALKILVKRPSKRAIHEKKYLRLFGDTDMPNAHGPLWAGFDNKARQGKA